MKTEKPKFEISVCPSTQRIVVLRSVIMGIGCGRDPLEEGDIEGDNPVRDCSFPCDAQPQCTFQESGCLGVQPKIGGKSHLRLNKGERPIAHKYREGKMQRTLKRELKVLEIVERETIGTSEFWNWRGFSWEGYRTVALVSHFGGHCLRWFSVGLTSAFPC